MAISRLSDGRFLDVNDAFVRMTGYAREEAVGRSLPLWKRPEERQEAIRELLAAGSLRDREHDYLCKSGETIHGLGAAELVEIGGERLLLSLVLDITQRKETEERLRHALADKETLIREVHHRVKNNLQILCDLLFLQGDLLQGEEGKAAIEDAYRRVFAIARLHEQLYQSLESGQVNLGEYLGRLIRGFEQLSARVRIVLDAPGDPVFMDVDRAIHTGLVVSELVTNAQKHAFPGTGTGEVRVRLRPVGDDVELEVQDDGRGLPPGLDVEQVASLGLRIVHILSRKLGAVLEIRSSDPGACFAVRFPRQPPA
jgi:PAS domain S-box-containing protein